jgi:hypothetical protein
MLHIPLKYFINLLLVMKVRVGAFRGVFRGGQDLFDPYIVLSVADFLFSVQLRPPPLHFHKQ